MLTATVNSSNPNVQSLKRPGSSPVLTPAVSILQSSSQSYDRFALVLENVGKCYRRYPRRLNRIRNWFGFNRQKKQEAFWAVRRVSFAVERGQTVGILGANGSGKSTLLQLVAGTLSPSEGAVAVNGRIAGLLELGSGFHPEFSGWENARLQAGILGLSPQEIEERLPAIAAFSELGDALNHPVRTYSSGMIVRLGFSVAISVDPDILLIDEALAVGDLRFQQKCMSRIRQLRERGVTILLVTHDLSAIKRLCDTAHVLEHGRLVQSGSSELVSNWYFGKMMSDVPEESTPSSATSFRHGEGGARLESWQFLDENNQPVQRVWLGKTYTLQIEVRFTADIAQPVLGFFLRDRLGTEVLGANTESLQTPLPPGRAGNRIRVDFRFPLRLRPGPYTLCVAIADDPLQARCLDWVDNALVLEVVDPIPSRTIHGLIAEDMEVFIHK